MSDFDKKFKRNLNDVKRGIKNLRKMNHVPSTFLRAAPDKPWLRIDGFATASEIMQEYRGLTTE